MPANRRLPAIIILGWAAAARAALLSSLVFAWPALPGPVRIAVDPGRLAAGLTTGPLGSRQTSDEAGRGCAVDRAEIAAVVAIVVAFLAAFGGWTRGVAVELLVLGS